MQADERQKYNVFRLSIDFRCHGDRLVPTQAVPVFLKSSTKLYKGVSQMSKTELTDNLTFLSALQMLRRLIQQGLLTDNEGALTRRELERKLRPTLLLP